MSEHFYWIWAIFFIIPLVSIIRRYLRKRNLQNFSKSSEQYHKMQFQTNLSEMVTPRRNFLEPEPKSESKPETKDIQVLGETKSWNKKFWNNTKNYWSRA